jgi:xanthine dehydrogenase accessory factor
MQEYMHSLNDWMENGHRVVLARVIKTWGSSPRPIGSIMLINDEGKMAGSVSGGCVEGEVVKKSKEVFSGNIPMNLNFGVSDDQAWSVGLTCGGQIRVFLQPMDKSLIWNDLMDLTETNTSGILVSSLMDGDPVNALVLENDEVIGDELSNELVHAAKTAYNHRTHQLISIEEKEYFIHVFPKKPQLLIIGAAHITVDLVSLANRFGFETIVIDPRSYFAEHTMFPDPPSQLIQEYPSEVLKGFSLDAYTFAAILSHDPKIDDNALEILLPSDVAYIGALGSRKTHAKRIQRLTDQGINQELIDRIHAPIGMNINGRSAREIALSIMAQVVEVKNQHLR